MENLNDLKTEMDNLIRKMEIELSNVKQARILIDAQPIQKVDGIAPNYNFLMDNDKKIIQPSLQKDVIIPPKTQIFSSNIPKINIDKNIPNIAEGFPYNGTMKAMLRYILHSKNRAVSEIEFSKDIARYLGEDSKVLKSVDRLLRSFSHPKTGEWTYFTFSKNGIKFFILPEWRDTMSNTVIPMRRADVAESGFGPNECNWNQLIWHRDK